MGSAILVRWLSILKWPPVIPPTGLQNRTIKMRANQYSDFYHNDNTASWLSNLYNGNPYTWEDGVYIEAWPCFPPFPAVPFPSVGVSWPSSGPQALMQLTQSRESPIQSSWQKAPHFLHITMALRLHAHDVPVRPATPACSTDSAADTEGGITRGEELGSADGVDTSMGEELTPLSCGVDAALRVAGELGVSGGSTLLDDSDLIWSRSSGGVADRAAIIELGNMESLPPSSLTVCVTTAGDWLLGCSSVDCSESTGRVSNTSAGALDTRGGTELLAWSKPPALEGRLAVPWLLSLVDNKKWLCPLAELTRTNLRVGRRGCVRGGCCGDCDDDELDVLPRESGRADVEEDGDGVEAGGAWSARM